MTSTTKETKTERLILNLTVQERHTLKEYSQQSNSTSESEFVRKAVELFVVLYRLVVAGSGIVLRNETKRQQHTIPIARKWSRDSAATPMRETPRQNFELKIEEAVKKVAFEIVAQGAAPSLTRLVWLAIGTHAHVMEWEAKGFLLMEQCGSEFRPVVKERSAAEADKSKLVPLITQQQSKAQTETAQQYICPLPNPPVVPCRADCPKCWPNEDLFGTSKAPKDVTTRDVLEHLEGTTPRRATIWLNHPDPLFLLGEENAIQILRRNCLLGCDYVLITNRPDASHLREALLKYLYPILKWRDYKGLPSHDLLQRRLHNEYKDWLDQPEVQESSPDMASPLWMQFSAVVLQGPSEVLTARYHDSPSWIFELHAEFGLPRELIGFSIGDGEHSGRAMRRPEWETEKQLKVLQSFKADGLWRRLGPEDYPPDNSVNAGVQITKKSASTKIKTA